MKISKNLCFFFCSYILLDTVTACLATQASQRLLHAFRPNTRKTYHRMFRDFLSFLVFIGLQLHQVNSNTMLSYMEYMVQMGYSHMNVSNNVAAIKSMSLVYGQDVSKFLDNRISLFIKSIKNNVQFSPVVKSLIDVEVLSEILQETQTFPHPAIYQPLYLFCFFSFLRISNILPHTIASFDMSRHLARGDVIFRPEQTTVIIKWSKTIHDRRNIKTIYIPVLGASPLCPVANLKAMFTIFPADKNQPLFLIPRANGNLVPLTDSVARKHLKQIFCRLQVPPPYTFHAFRKAGCTWAFHHGVPIHHLMAQGTWASDCIWRYIASNPSLCNYTDFSPISTLLATSYLGAWVHPTNVKSSL